ncbi:restriction endonuclease subunit S [Parasutterella excrementihominis]|uniref:restriction endonuclease subunit S n=1 Tax=Parasutterella excrementihominis TaxID=487175 RepID=UPI002430374D|nr:restriction endonuclease subunit S [Parasutterella excrementihominis]
MNQNKSVKIRFKGFTETWEQRKLEELTSIFDGTHQTPQYTKEGVMFLSVENISTLLSQKFISKEDFNRNFPVKPAFGDVLMTRIGDVGTANMVRSDRDLAFYVSLALLKPKNVNSLFLTSAIASPFVQKEIWKRTLQVAFPKKINKNEIGKVQIYCPETKEEQLKIGQLFEAIEKVITLHQRKLNRFQKIRTTFLQKMFPKNGETKPAIRLTGFNADWEQEKLQNFAVRITRKNIKKQNNRPLTISAQHGLVDQTVYFNNRVAAQDVSNYYLIKKGEFAYNRSTSKDAPVGAVRRLVDYEEGVLSTLYLVFSITDPQHVDPNYLSYFFETTGWHSWILERAAEGARNHGLLNVSSQDFLSLPVMLSSSLEEQQKIGEFFQKIDDCIILLERQADLLKQIKSSLLLSMFPSSNAE